MALQGRTIDMTRVTTFFIEECCNCGVLFGMTSELHSQRLGDKFRFYCPNGHGQHYLGEAWEKKITRLQDQLAVREAEVKRLDRSLTAQRGQMTKLRHRVGNGVCPCCHRSFVNVQRHMSTQHPDYAA